MAAYFSSWFNPKAKKWIQGRKNIFERLEKAIPAGEKIIWIHCASLGEFEQGRPVMEKIKKEYPGYRILLTFFSSSGYEIQKNYPGVDWVFYLPLDGPRTAKRFLQIVHPSLVIFVKYEFWYYYLEKSNSGKIPLLLVSALFRKDSVFFKWYGRIQRKMLGFFHHIFLQNENSRELLGKIGLSSICSVSGDTRFDRVAGIAENAENIPLIEQFLGNNRAIIAGSTWPEEENILQQAMAALNDPSVKLIIAPHEIHEKHLNDLKKLFPSSILFSELQDAGPHLSSILIIDNIGMLSRLYKYAYITYVGGGFRNGLHNILEAAVYYKPVLFGPKIQRYSEAIGLVGSGGGVSFKNSGELAQILNSLLADREEYDRRSKAAGDFIQSQRGATQKIMDYIQENRLLTR